MAKSIGRSTEAYKKLRYNNEKAKKRRADGLGIK